MRLYAEDPDQGFLPQAGRLAHVRWPGEARIDSGVEEGAAVTTHYDPMLAKVIVHGAPTGTPWPASARPSPRPRSSGVRTNLAFLRAVAADPVVTRRTRDHHLARARLPGVDVGNPGGAARRGGGAGRRRRGGPDPRRPARRPTRGRRHRRGRGGSWGRRPAIVVLPGGGHGARRSSRCRHRPLRASPATTSPGRRPRLGRRRTAAAVAPGADGHWYVLWGGLPYEIAVGPRLRLVDAEGGPAHLGAPMPGTVIAVRVEIGEKVTKGQELVVVEAMKMELAVKANIDAIVAAVQCAPGEQVGQGQTLIDLEPNRRRARPT